MPQPSLNVRDHLPRIGFIPAAIELLGGEPELDHEIARQVLRFDLASLLAPEPDQRGLVITHDDPGVRTADEVPSVCDFS